MPIKGGWKDASLVLQDFSRSTKHCIHFSRDIRTKFDILNLPQFIDIGQNRDGGISDFRISGQFLIKENCDNARTSDDNGMKFEPVTKLDKEKKATSKNDDDIISEIVTSLSFFQLMANLEQSRSLCHKKLRFPQS